MEILYFHSEKLDFKTKLYKLFWSQDSSFLGEWGGLRELLCLSAIVTKYGCHYDFFLHLLTVIALIISLEIQQNHSVWRKSV